MEITSAESIGVGNRGGYYEGSGALRDMLQNHLLLLASLIAMEPPALINSNSIRNEIVKVQQSIRPIKEEDVEKQVIRGQYVSSTRITSYNVCYTKLLRTKKHCFSF